MDLFSPFIWLILFRLFVAYSMARHCKYNRIFDLFILIIVQIEIETGLCATLFGWMLIFDKKFLNF